MKESKGKKKVATEKANVSQPSVKGLTMAPLNKGKTGK